MSETKMCPYCAEEIKSAAIVCKHCNRPMPGYETEVPLPVTGDRTDPQGLPQRVQRQRSPVLILAPVAILLIALAAGMAYLAWFGSDPIGKSSTSSPDEDTPPGPDMKIIPLAIKAGASENGWRTYTLDLAFENHGDQYGMHSIWIPGAKAETSEGFSYPLSANLVQHWVTGDYLKGVNTIDVPRIPPGFRAKGEVRMDPSGPLCVTYQLHFEAAASSHPTKIVIPQYGVIELTEGFPEPVFPSDQVTGFQSVPDSIEVIDRFRITIKEFSHENLDPETRTRWPCITGHLTFENLDPGYEQSSTLSFAAVGNDGYVLPQANIHLQAGPSQIVETSVCIPLYARSWESRVVSSNFRVVVYGGSLENEFRVYDAGF